MKYLLLRWLSTALALYLVAQFVPGIHLHGAVPAIIAAAALGFVNAVLRPIILFFVWPLNCLTLGLLGFVINALLFQVTGSGIVPGFRVDGLFPALIGSVVMAIFSSTINFIVADRSDEQKRGRRDDD